MNKGYGIYIHWPFCLSKCPYCDFNSHVSNNIDIKAWQNAYSKEIEYYKKLLGNINIDTIFFGGGTPSLMPPKLIEFIILKIGSDFTLDPQAEITMEANPSTIENEKFQAFKSAGINRVSIGVQSLYDDQLKFLGRKHSALEAINAVTEAAKIFDNYSFDLIYARPGQTIESWEKELNQALSLVQNHFSLYQLTIEKGTLFYTYHQRGDLILPNDEECAKMYELTAQMLAKQNLYQYEISNYARAGFESKHNLNYWRYGNYIGIGPGAHGRISINKHKYATTCHRAPEIWLNSCNNGTKGIKERTELSQTIQIQEQTMMGLRLIQGLDIEIMEQQHGAKLWEVINKSNLDYLITQGILTKVNSYLRIDSEHLIRADGITRYLMEFNS